MKYVLPDYSNSKEGYILQEGQNVKEDQQVLVLGNERFAVPELLFTPSDVGMEFLSQPLSPFQPHLPPLFYSDGSASISLFVFYFSVC